MHEDKYTVEFNDINSKLLVNAFELYLLDNSSSEDDDEPSGEIKSINNANSTNILEDKDELSEITTATPTGHSSLQVQNSEKSIPLQNFEDDVRNIPMSLQVANANKKNKFNLLLLNSTGQTLASITDAGESRIKTYIIGKNSIIEQTLTKAKVGIYRLKQGFELKGELQSQYAIFQKQAESQIKFEQSRIQRLKQPVTANTEISQKELFKRLQQLHSKTQTVKNRHPTIMMTKIKLDSPIILHVGGKAREITFLYTQPGNSHEIRCYLGNNIGAYQRVHTSITLDDHSSAHTMVQIGENIVIPGYHTSNSSRIGFDSVEGVLNDMPHSNQSNNYGFANRKLTVRNKKQSTVKDFLKGVDANDLTQDQLFGCHILASRFNQALDNICSDIMNGEVESRMVTGITSDFTILDDSWLFENNQPATPENEYRQHLQSNSNIQHKTSENSNNKSEKKSNLYPGENISQKIKSNSNNSIKIVQVFATWEEAESQIHVEGTVIKITRNIYGDSDTEYMVTETYDPKKHSQRIIPVMRL